ncbi:hypothetical protein Tco_1212137 [Tanacetum coccineum]
MANTLVVIALHGAWSSVVQPSLVVEGKFLLLICPCTLMSMGRVFKTRLRRRGAKQFGKINIEFKIADEYMVKFRRRLSHGGVEAEVAVGCGGVERQWWWLMASSVDISGGWRRWMMMAGQDSRGGDVGGGDKGEGGGCGVVKVTGRRWWRYSGCGGEAAGVRVSGVEARDKGDRVDRVTRNHIWFRPERSPENFSGGGGMVAGLLGKMEEGERSL